jgi:quercetin dioxygenase-like cupin family protein
MDICLKNETNPLIRPDGVKMIDFFKKMNAENAKVSMGFAEFPHGTVVPWAAHDGDEYAYVLSGSVECETKENGLIIISEGDASFIPAGQEHSSRNISRKPATLIWMLVEKSE